MVPTPTSPDRKLPALVYLTQMRYPSPAAHSIQISRTVAALGKFTKVYVVVKELGSGVAAAEKQYGLDFEGRVEFVQCTPRFGMLGMLWLAWRMSRIIGGPFVFYTRTYSFARKLIRTKRWHKRPVFFESHKKRGYFKEDKVDASGFTNLRNEEEAKNESRETIDEVYLGADQVFFLHDHSREIAARDLGLKNAVWNWYGVDLSRVGSPGVQPRFDFIYCGSVTRGKLVGLLLDAAANLTRPFAFHIYGKCDEETRLWLEKEISARGLSRQVVYQGMLPFAELQKRLPEYRTGIATMEGIKVVDYIENGLSLVIPDIVSYREIFGDDDVYFFKSDDAADLANAMQASLDNPERRSVSAETVRPYSLEERARRIVGGL